MSSAASFRTLIGTIVIPPRTNGRVRRTLRRVDSSDYSTPTVELFAGWRRRLYCSVYDFAQRDFSGVPPRSQSLRDHAGAKISGLRQRPAPRLRGIVVRPAARSAGASPAAPLGGIRQHEQVHTGEEEQDEREQRQEAHPEGLLLLFHGDEVDDDGHRKGDGHPAVDLPNPFVPVQWDLLFP